MFNEPDTHTHFLTSPTNVLTHSKIMELKAGGRGGERARLDWVHAPIGANIGADTPEEIAVSVVAELIAVRRGSYKPWKTKRATGDVG